LVSLPSGALAAERLLTPALVFVHATPFGKLIMLSLVAAMIAAFVVTIRKLASGPSLAGGSAFVSNLRLGGPLIGMLGASYSALNSAVGVANFKPANLIVIAPGVAESLLVFGLGVLAGSVAVFANWALEARIDRVVLRP
jgi:biopolymer transport protein ExbB/TolQ